MKMNIEFMDEKSHFRSKIEDDIEKEVYEIIKGGIEYFEQQEQGNVSIEAFEQTSKWRNILLDWYSFREGAKILEVGAGVGALTGLLSDNAEQLTSLEKKTSRCEILKERYQNRKNLNIQNVNFFEYSPEEKYDYIVFHEIFGYIKKYCKEAMPYITVLKKLKGLLKKNGVLLLMAENRLGLKYFSGSIEEYSCRLFGGLNNFDGFDFIKTLTKSEYINLINTVGFQRYRFYYPFPDCVFPTEIFTNDILCDIYYGGLINETNSERLEFFNEQRMFRTLQKEGIVTKFANSFLIEISNKEIFDNFLYSYADDKADFGEHRTIICHNAKKEKFAARYCEGKMNNRILIEGYQRLDQLILKKLDLIDSDTVEREKVIESIYYCFSKQIKSLCEDTLQEDRGDKLEFEKIFGENLQANESTKLVDKFISVKDIYVGEKNEVVSYMPIGTDIPIEFAIWKFIEDWYVEFIFGNYDYEKYVDLNTLFIRCNININEVVTYRRWIRFYNKTNQCLRKYYKGKYKCNYIYTADICENGTPIISLDNDDNKKDISKLQILEEKRLLDLLRK